MTPTSNSTGSPAVLIACWSAKGEAGTTVVATSLALMVAQRESARALIVDLAGDVPAMLGTTDPDSPGIAEWLHTSNAVPPSELERLQLDVAPRLALLPRGNGPLDTERSSQLASALKHAARQVIVDCSTLRGSTPDAAAGTIARAADHSLLVIRPDYLSLRHATTAPIRPTGAVVVQQPHRSLGASDVERVLDVPLVAQLEDEPGAARAIDCGLLAVPRLPRSIQNGLRLTVESMTLDRIATRLPRSATQPPQASL